MGITSSGGERFVVCGECQYRGPKVKADAKEADRLTFEGWNAVNPLPDYSYATQRIQQFASEAVNWDGGGGLPASPEASGDVLKFLAVAQLERLDVPGLAMGGDGSVAVIWTSEDLYISADFDGAGSYSFFISQGETLACSGIGLPGEVNQELSVYLRKHFSHCQAQ